jgi:glucosamine 6-phosphate synthetase-like amidotransferase/phosphosugar isomerase protein
MCGIAGALILRPNRPNLTLLRETVRQCRRRGEDSFGAVSWSPSAGWREARETNGSIDLLDGMFPTETDGPHFFLHTSRAEPTTEFQQNKTARDIPPFRVGDIAVAHNGIIANDGELARTYGITPPSAIDTAVLPALVAQVGFWRAVRELQGGSAIGVIDAHCARLRLARNFLPLVVAWMPGMLAFASEASFLPGHEAVFPPFRLWEMPPYTGIEFSPAGYHAPIPWGEDCVGADQSDWIPYPSE